MIDLSGINLKPKTKKFIEATKTNDTDPVSLYNQTHALHAISAMLDKIKTLRVINDNKLIDDLTGVEIDFDGYHFKASMNGTELDSSISYTPFMILSKFSFNGNHRAAYEWINGYIINGDVEYMRVGASYFKKIKSSDRYGIERLEIKPWKKEEIVEDYTKKILERIPRFDTFIIEPDNCNHSEVVNSCYNLYSKFSHKPRAGKIYWSSIIMEHIFGEQINLGYQYLKVLYQHPKQILPILVLASQTRQTGKSTFINWLNQIFGANMVVINPEEIMGAFNSSFAKANIIAIEETVSDKSATVEKLKSLSTQKFINVNQKFIDNYKLPFFGKFIITTNDERKFMKVDEDEIRFWVRKIPSPRVRETNIEQLLIDEIPAFLQHLIDMPDIDFSKSRMVFTENEINTEGLEAVKQESMPSLYKDLLIYLDEYFRENTHLEEVSFTPTELKTKYFYGNSNIGVHYIGTILKDFFKLEQSACSVYKRNLNGDMKTGRYYTLKKQQIMKDIDNQAIIDLPIENSPF
jgi:mannose/fructose/N-acetylgalactosamine-specific phosphotransferase system component IIB